VNNPGSPVLASSFTRLGSIIPPRSPLENCTGSPSNAVTTPVAGQHQISHQTTPCNSSSTPNGYLTHPSSASPRTRIRTTLGRSSLCSQNSSSETLKENSSANNSPPLQLSGYGGTEPPSPHPLLRTFLRDLAEAVKN